MTILKETTGDVLVCDGCGRSDDSPGQVLNISPYVVWDPNVGSAVQHHYDVSCAANRGLAPAPVVIQGWVPAEPAVTPEPVETDEPAAQAS
jgi:hypothetical protein